MRFPLARFGLSSMALIVLSLFTILTSTHAWATDDSENSTPTAWWIYTGQSLADIGNTINTKSARIVDISVDNPSAFTVTYVRNSGTFAKAWWYYVGIDAPTVSHYLSVNNARLISLKAYDIGGGNIRFAVVMISNTGADAKAWWWYFGQNPANLSNLLTVNKARLTTLQSYTSNGQTVYAAVMIANQGTDAKGWWWYYNVTPQFIGNAISANQARLVNFTANGNGTFNVVMESCSGGCPAWWWYYGLDGNGVLTHAQDNGARVATAQTYPCANSSGRCFATTMISNAPNDVIACDSAGCISEAKLSANICGTLAGKVVGYSCAVGGVRPGFGGLARTSANPPQTAMTPNLVTNIASVSKTMTAVGVLQLLAKNGLTIDSKIAPYLYTDWSKGSNISKLTFKHLLTHSSGFGQLPGNACGNGITYATLKSIVAGGVNASNIGSPSYGNCNFALLREIMPALMGQPLNALPDGPLRAQQSSTLYINYINSHVFEPVGVSPRSCNAPSDASGILSYPFPAGSASGTDWGDWSLQCGGGGWVMSGDDIFKVINDLATGNTLLTPSQRKQMFSNCLGWDCAVRSDCPSPYVCKNGDLTNGAGVNIWTYAGVVKCNVPVVVVVNSPLPAPYQPGNDVIGLVQNSLKNAEVPGTPTTCP